MPVLSKDVSLVKYGLSSQRFVSLVLGGKMATPVHRVQLWRSTLSGQRMQVLSKDVSLVKGCLSRDLSRLGADQ